MNELEWLSGTDPTPMLKFAQSKQRRRTVRLFSCACCRSLWPLLSPESQRSVEAAERFADGLASTAELDAAHAKANDSVLALPNIWSYEVERLRHATSAAADCSVSRPATMQWAVAISRKAAEAIALDAAVKVSKSEFAQIRDCVRIAEFREQANLVREIFGNPYHPVLFSPDWQTETAVLLARRMYETGEFGAMPILADALQDAGCENDVVLSHCRDATAAHSRGCWVLDPLLGKAPIEAEDRRNLQSL
jgi:hypothetical protein